MQNIISETTSAQAPAVPSVKLDDVPLENKTKEVPAEDDVSDEDDDLPLRVGFKKRKIAELCSNDSGSEAGSVSSLSDQHKSVLLTVFQDEISKGKLLTMAEVRAKMRGDNFLRIMVTNRDLVKKVADFVRYQTNHTRHMQLTDLELDESNFVASLSNESGPRKTWNASDTAVIESKFESLPHVKGKKAILELFTSDQVLAHILDREGMHRCYEKVKNILKRKKQC